MEGQFTIIQNKALLDERLSAIDKVILLNLQSMMGVNGYCWPSYNYLAEKANCSRRSVIRSMKRLVYYNYVRKTTGTVGETNEQSSNRYYINNNPDAGIVTEKTKKDASGVSDETPRKNERGVTQCHSDVVTQCHPEKDKFFEKNACACARTREGENDTPNDKTESGLSPVAQPDDLQNVNCPISSEDEDVRLWRDINAEWKKAFNKSLSNFGEVSKHNNGYLFRPFVFCENSFNFDDLAGIFNKKSSVCLDIVSRNLHYSDERMINYDV